MPNCAMVVPQAGAVQTILRMMHVLLPRCSTPGTGAPIGLALGAPLADSLQDGMLEGRVRSECALAAALAEMMVSTSLTELAVLAVALPRGTAGVGVCGSRPCF